LLYTSYLSKKRSFPDNFEVVYVMIGRGNDIVAPNKDDLEAYKNGSISWHEYSRRYREKLENIEAWTWMKNIATRARQKDVVLVCYEKDASHCHRSILLSRIRKLFPSTPIGGEL